jgi:hypothetical protein
MQDTRRFISGIQQVGIGVRDAHQALHHYKQIFSMETLVFDDTSEASLMTRYTGGSVYQRRAMLSLNMQGGGGMEIWQFNNRKPSSPAAPVQYGDIGICAVRIKCQDPAKAQAYLQTVPEAQVSELQTDQQGTSFFWVKDQYDNLFQVISGNHWFWKRNRLTGGISGAVIGVSDMDKALAFYSRLLQPDVIAYDYTTTLKNPFSEQRVVTARFYCKRILPIKVLSENYSDRWNWNWYNAWTGSHSGSLPTVSGAIVALFIFAWMYMISADSKTIWKKKAIALPWTASTASIWNRPQDALDTWKIPMEL